MIKIQLNLIIQQKKKKHATQQMYIARCKACKAEKLSHRTFELQILVN